MVRTCESHQLIQLNNKPTIITPTSRTLIDVIMTTEPQKIIEDTVISVFIADHHLVYCVFSYQSHTSTQTHRTKKNRIFKNFNIGEFCNDLNLCDWVSIEQFEDVDETYRRFKDLFTQVCDKHCPVLTRRVRQCFLTYLTEEIKNILK